MGDIRLLVALRWAAIIFQSVSLGLAHWAGFSVDWDVLSVSIVIQFAANVGTLWGERRGIVRGENYILAQLLFDFSALVVFVAFSGGIANPFSGLFLVQALLAALLISRLKMGLMFVLTGLGYAVLLFALPGSDHHQPEWIWVHTLCMVVNHILTIMVIGWIIVKIVNNLRHRERQMMSHQGLIAAGAFSAQVAHRLATPLNTIALVADDLGQTEIGPDRDIILSEISRAKQYLNRLFSRLVRIESGQTDRLDLPNEVNQLVTMMQFQYPQLHFETGCTGRSTIRGSSMELLLLLAEILIENAAEAGAKTVHLHLEWKDQLKMCVSNDGPPLSDDFYSLMTVGRSTKTEIPHFGMGLFLARLLIESLSAEVDVVSPPGVSITISIPSIWVDAQ